MSKPTNPGSAAPVPPIAIAGGAAAARAVITSERVEIPDEILARLQDACSEVTVDSTQIAESSRDWWPLGMIWATTGGVPSLGSAVARPTSTEEVSQILRICNEARIPVTPSAGRSGVLGAAVPLFGGLVLDMCSMSGIRSIDADSLTVDVLPGTFGHIYEEELRSRGFSGGHWPQSMTLSTVGGWLACRGAGQFSTRYGKIEDIVVGLDVVLADGSAITTGGFPRAAVGPDLTQLFVGSEGTLGVITGARLKIHRLPEYERRSAWSFDTFEDGLDWSRRVIQAGATPAVLRLYDEIEAESHFHLGDNRPLAVVLDEGARPIVDGMMDVVKTEAERGGATRLDDSLVDQWLNKRNEVSALEALISRGFVVDTMEVSAPWSDVAEVGRRTLDAIRSVEGILAASAHSSHTYLTGACLYFTFAGQPTEDGAEEMYRAIWSAGASAALESGASLSHHHGVGLNRSRFVRDALDGGLDVLNSLKTALDANGILNPAKLGLDSPYGDYQLFR